MTFRFSHLLALILCGSALSSRPALAAPVWSAPLTGSQIDTVHWTINAPNAGVTLQATSTGVLMTVAGSASGANLYAQLMSTCTLVGDFDVQVDYALGPWPAHSGVRTALGTGVGGGPALASHAAVERVSLSGHDVVVQTPASEVYLADFLSVNPFPDVATTDMQGTLRLTRTGGIETAYFGTAGNWTMLYAATTTSEPVKTVLQTWSDDQFFDTAAGGGSDTFRNYVVTSGQLNCPDAGAPDASPPDAAAHVDGGNALDAHSPDVATPLDGDSPDGSKKNSSGGCNCDVVSGSTSTAASGLLLLTMLAMLRRRRRRPM
jgi:MYXO-CTERM domain-containing protein